MAYSRRLQNELDNLKEAKLKFIREIKIDETNILKWEVLLAPEHPPYNKAAFWLEITYPEQYPFKPPSVVFKTKIYHPNIDENGMVCLSLVNVDHWKPGLKMSDIFTALNNLINTPEPEHALRTDVAEEYVNERKKFMKHADEYTKKFGEKKTS